MKSLLTITAIFEAATGLALAVLPALVVSLLLGTSLSDPAAILVCRLTGGALLTIAIACWLSKTDTESLVMVKVMLGYNLFATTLLLYAVLAEGIKGPALLPAVLFHVFLFIWCVLLVWKSTKKIK